MSSPEKDFPDSEMSVMCAPRRIVCDAHTCFGKPRIEGTRLSPLLFVGMTREQVVEAWPHLDLTDEEWTAIQRWLDSAEGRRAQQQEPTGMPGFEAARGGPLPPKVTLLIGEGWPPLSREQVVELHEALVSFVQEMSSARKPMSSDDQQTTIWGAAVGLHGLLERLNIGTPPQPRRWTDDDIQAALEKHELPTAILDKLTPLGGFACLDERRMLPPEEEPKHNCGTCQHYHQPSEMGCGVMVTSPGARMWRMNAGAALSDAQLQAWLEQSGDGCPGWEPKP